jgi:hypothetical protein
MKEEKWPGSGVEAFHQRRTFSRGSSEKIILKMDCLKSFQGADHDGKMKMTGTYQKKEFKGLVLTPNPLNPFLLRFREFLDGF